MSVQLSVATVLALVTAPIAGVGLLAARMLGKSGRVILTRETLARSKADLAVIVVYDMVGACVAILVFILFGVSKPPFLISYFDSQPAIAWAVFGIVGPLFAVGILDRLPVIRFVSLSAAGGAEGQDQVQRDLRASLADGVALRRKSVERILKCHYEDIVVTEDTERIRLLHKATRLIAGGTLEFRDIAVQIERYVEEVRGGDMPPELETVLGYGKQVVPTIRDPFLSGEKLVGVALDQGLSRPVNIACRIAEGVAGRPGSSQG